MFKLESYITPVILSYVEKYVKNFKPEQSQLSLWGGDASFQNLDLRLEVLEEQLNLPFSFVSGHIHELLIHVPWVKITSEPIVVTINTIECILRLKDGNDGGIKGTTSQKKKVEPGVEETLSGYMKSIVNKIVNNITIRCNNLILKYVEEDIVLSCNVRSLEMETVNENWQPAFIDVNDSEVILRKVIKITDLTLCLDKMDASGKIEMYQEPVLYRCSMVMRLTVNYHNSTSEMASSTRLDIHCQKMTFSVTTLQIPMLIRLFTLVVALQTQQLPSSRDKMSSSEETVESVGDENDQAGGPSREVPGWGGWAWDVMTSVLPVNWDNEWSNEQQMSCLVHSIRLGFYVDYAILTFKRVESVKEQVFYKGRKTVYKPFLSLHILGAVVDVLRQGITMSNLQVGLSSIGLDPSDTCSCGYPEVVDKSKSSYIFAGNRDGDHLKGSLFDKNISEIEDETQKYTIHHYTNEVEVEKLLQRYPAFAMNSIHYLEVPDDVTPEILAEFGSTFEQSNFPERTIAKCVIGDVTVRACSGLLHRLNTIKEAAAKYDYSPYTTLKSEPSLDDLPLITTEEYDTAREKTSTTEIIAIGNTIHLQLADHCLSCSTDRRKFVDSQGVPSVSTPTDNPFVEVKWDKISVKIIQPLYPLRTVACALKNADRTESIIEDCYKSVSLKVEGISGQLFLRDNCHTSVLMPCYAECTFKLLIYPRCWKNLDLIHTTCSLNIRDVTITGTKAKLMTTASIVASIFQEEITNNPLMCSSLFTDACQEKDQVYLELCIENIHSLCHMSIVTVSIKAHVHSVKMFALTDSQQVFILSGPECNNSEETEAKLFTAIVQFPNESGQDVYPPIVKFRVAEIRSSLDPLLCQWLRYRPTYFKLDPMCSSPSDDQQPFTEESSDPIGNPKKNFPSLQESIHSSSDKERKKYGFLLDESKTASKFGKCKKIEPIMAEPTVQKTLPISEIFVKMAELYPWWPEILLNGSIGHIIIYVPTSTMSGIDVHGIEQAKDQALRNHENLQIFTIQIPATYIHSTNFHLDDLLSHHTELPIAVSKHTWTSGTSSFPWTLKIENFACYTLKRDMQLNVIKKMSLNATIGLTGEPQFKDVAFRSNVKDNLPPSLGICVHVDMTPITASVSKDQVVLITNITSNMLNVMLRSSENEQCEHVNESSDPVNETSAPVLQTVQSVETVETAPSPSQIFFTDNTVTSSTVSIPKEELEESGNQGLLVTAFIQWTITKVTLKLYIENPSNGPELKLVLELEDIITSLNLQPVYLQLKNKITTATIFHYKRDFQEQVWEYGEFNGLVMAGREDSPKKKEEDSGFLILTLTRAKSRNVHTRWKTQNRTNMRKKNLSILCSNRTESYITEMDIKMQMIDVVLPLRVLDNYVQLTKPLIHLYRSINTMDNIKDKPINLQSDELIGFNSSSLPLIFLDFKGLRLMVPISSNYKKELLHDLLTIQLDGIEILPQAENPICRMPLRSDIYHSAAHANILNIPGSAVEDRQYQFVIKEMCAYTASWINYQSSIVKRTSRSCLYTMNENPALEWNKLGDENSLKRDFATLPIITRCDLCIVVAPAIVLKPDTIVCGTAVEINLKDIEIVTNYDQIELLSLLLSQVKDVTAEYTELIGSNNKPSTSVSVQRAPTLSAKHFSWNKRESTEPDLDFAKDSGVNFEMSSMNSTIVGKFATQETSKLITYVFEINCGKITYILYELQRTSSLHEEDMVEIDEVSNSSTKLPLLYAMVNQPNVYIAIFGLSRKIKVSCFDVALSLGDDASDTEKDDLVSIPTSNDFKIPVIETKCGDSHPVTGIPPSFLVVKYEKVFGRDRLITVDTERPTKIHVSLSRWRKLISIKDKMSDIFSSEVDENSESMERDDHEKHMLGDPREPKEAFTRNYSPDFALTTKQIVLSFQVDSGSEVLFSLAALSGNVSTLNRPDRICGNVSIDSFVVSSILDNRITVLLNPWCCCVTAFFSKSSNSSDTFPRLQLQADSDSIYVVVGPRQIKIINELLHDFQEIYDRFVPNSKSNEDMDDQGKVTTEQYYKDDLKAGAFQFIDGNSDELPLPYQVAFYSQPRQAMAWRYPQPRTVTTVHVSPVPFKVVMDEENYQDQVLCTLEYWSECHAAYQPYAEIYLSETESYCVDLPKEAPARSVACSWRVVVCTPEKEESKGKILHSVRALAACLRIDSYFEPKIIPIFQGALNVGTIHLAFCNQVEPDFFEKLPEPLEDYRLSDRGTVPDTQCFLAMDHKNAVIVVNKWVDGTTLVDVVGISSVRILDYGFLTMQESLSPLTIKAQFCVSSRKTDFNISCEPFSIRFGPAIAHTLGVSTRLWMASFDDHKSKILPPTRYIIANDTDVPICFGQADTKDAILLQTRECYFYSWKHPGHTRNQTMRISLGGNQWSRPFSINQDDVRTIEFPDEAVNATVFLRVSSLSATQKLVKFYGQLIISNRLTEAFEMKLVKYTEESNNRNKLMYLVPGRSQPPSIVLERGNGPRNDLALAMRLRFRSMTSSSWTGDVPLHPNAKFGQPWLVKVPLQERGQFLSIWVRIVTQRIQGRTKILAVLSPLYTIRSHLPVPVQVRIETPSLKVSSTMSVKGRGEVQQLYCPGTFEQSHQLTFQLDPANADPFRAGISSSDPYVPLSYSLIDQRKYFKRSEDEDIDTIIKTLDNIENEDPWPFQADDDIQDWISTEQPQTHAQVKYRDGGLVSSTLLLELQPWCFFLNSIGCHLSLVSEDVELCQIPHRGIVTPPKLEGSFHLNVGIDDIFYTSPILQLARPDWSQNFYMPRIEGLIPVEGNVKIPVDCESSMCILSIRSNMHEDMRLVRIASSHVIGNNTDQELRLAAIVIHEKSNDLCLPSDLTPFSIKILPSKDQRETVPVVQWHMLYPERPLEPVAFYISLSLNQQWSCPVRVGQGISRRSIAVRDGSTTIPVVMTTQEDKGTLFIMLYRDEHPQLFIENTCSFTIVLGQANASSDAILLDSEHFSWMCEVESGCSSHYSTPIVGSKLPDSPSNNSTTKLLLSAVIKNKAEFTDRRNLQWSRHIDLSVLSSTHLSDQYVRIPHVGDVKLSMYSRCHTVHIKIMPISQVEISARDIRSRLLHKEADMQITSAMVNTRGMLQLDESKSVAHSQTSASTSETSFLSAQEHGTITDVSDSSQHNVELSTSDKNINDVDVWKNEQSAPNLEERSEQESSFTLCLRGVTIVLTKDINECAQSIEVANLHLTDTFVTSESKSNVSSLCLCIGDVQLDNQLFDHGGFDFPVVLISQSPRVAKERIFSLSNRLNADIDKIQEDSLIVATCIWEKNGRVTACKDIYLKVSPISAYIEDTYISQLLDYGKLLVPSSFVASSTQSNETNDETVFPPRAIIYAPYSVILDSKTLSSPLRLHSLVIEPVSILLSVHTFVRLYVALDHSPLYFGSFERTHLLTTPYRLGNALIMHYLSGAIFGAGWVVGSLEILGSPGGLAQALGSGLKDFISMPFHGLLQGPWGFVVGITHGSASLVKHITAGTVNSVTKLASSVARNLDRLTLDEEHLQRQEESRRSRPQGVAQGLFQGLTGLGMSLLGAVAGLAHHPLQQVWSGDATTTSVVTGVGLGLVGVITKPLSGAAELVALTGQGLLRGAGWNSLPSPRRRPIIHYTSSNCNAPVKYSWMLLPMFDNGKESILHVANADHIVNQTGNQAVTLVLTHKSLFLINSSDDSVERIFSVKELMSVDHPYESNMLCLYCPSDEVHPTRSSSPTELPEMDEDTRGRVEEYVRTSSKSLTNLLESSDTQSNAFETVSEQLGDTISFYVSSDSRNYLLSLFNIAKRQSSGNQFTVL
ncbi:vacuolar protein sorting-associated protein 13B [Orussus abietinus]|uniref:vacuolar protein sorting-associated protein 13B n=1 Tax=Orussus abietinus TaxID=222816 RepID=UPI000626BA4A|nr:vacuolar protein sorting-associated protein 13B [Orussus abietinus]